MVQYTFYFLSLLAIISAFLVVFSKSPVHSVLYLVACFFAIAGHFLLLNAQFLAIVHIIVYGGAIMVLFLFVVMMLNLNKESDSQKSNYVKLAAIAASGFLLLTIVASVKSYEVSSQMVMPLKGQGSVQSIGKELFSTFLLPFEISSILLFAAVVGAVMLAKKEID